MKPTQTKTPYRTMNRLFCYAVCAMALGLTSLGRAAISVPTLTPITFDTAPAVEDWSTAVFNGGGTTFQTPAVLDAFVQQTNAAGIRWPLPTVSEATPSTFAGGYRYNSLNRYIQSRPTTSGTNAACALMATLRNDSGSEATTVSITYTFNKPVGQTDDELPGWHVYYSLTGQPGSWVKIPALSGVDVPVNTPTTLTAVLDLSATPWQPGSLMYVLWVDDNDEGQTDAAYTMDNVLFEVPTPPSIVTQPPALTTVLQNRPFSLSVVAAGVPLNYQWYKVGVGAIDGATGPTYEVRYAQLSDAGTYYVEVFNALGRVRSSDAVVVVNADTEPPQVRQAVGSASFDQITIQFNEEIDTNTLPDIVDIIIDGPGGLGVQSLYVTNNNTVLVLLTDLAQQPDADYSVTFAGITDLAGNPVADPTVVQFHSWVPSPFGGVVFQVYTNLSTSDNNLRQLTNNINYPYVPAETYVLTNLNTRDAYPDDSHEGYGGRLRCLFIPLVSGQYRFFIRSDDASRLYLNPTGPGPEGAILVAEEPGCCNAFLEPPATQTSEPFELQAGRGYYVEAIYKEGTGGDYCQVAARLEGDPTPAASLPPLGGSYVGFQAVPKGVVGEVSIVQQPASIEVEQPASATFSVVAQSTLGSPFVYQWQKKEAGGADFVDIPNATTERYSTGPTLAAEDDGDQYRVIVRSPGGELISEPATLTVRPDTTPPVVLGAQLLASGTTILLSFSEPMDPVLAGDTLSYKVCEAYNMDVCLDIQTATLTNANQAVLLELLTPPTPGVVYRAVVEEYVTDTVGNPMGHPRSALVGTPVSFRNGDPTGYNGCEEVQIRQANPTSNFGNDVVMLVDNSDGGGVCQGLIRFRDIFGELPWQIPPDATINSAILRLTSTTAGAQSPGTIRLYLMLLDWDENTVTWSSIGNGVRPGEQALLDVQAAASPNWGADPPPGGIALDFDVTKSIRLWHQGVYPNYGWVMINDSDDGYRFDSSETNVLATRPMLIVNWSPLDVTNAIVIVSQPPPIITVNEGDSLALTVVVTGTQPSYQWYHNDAIIPGATAPTYTIPVARPADAGKYYCRITNPAGSVQTADSQVIVVSDRTPPVALSAKGGPASNPSILVTYSEPVDVTSATTVGNYELLGPGGVSIVNAAMADDSAVTLTLSGPRLPGENYQLRIRDVLDRAFVPNVLDPNPTTLPVATWVELISINTHPWKYLQQTDLGVGPCLDGEPWTMPDYDDSAWQTGYGIFFGHRTNSVNQPAPNPAVTLPLTLNAADPEHTQVLTILNVFTNAGNLIQETNYYFRTTFVLPTDSTNGVSLMLHSMIDDGASFYINGVPVAHIRMDPAQLSCVNLATGLGDQVWSPALDSPGQLIGLEGLRPGRNTLAVQLHQNSTTSSDITLGVVLTAEVLTQLPPAPRLGYTYNPETKTLTLIWDAAGFQLEEAPTVVGPWTPVPGATSPWAVSAASGTKFFRLHKP
jgi:hypothetical protein